MRENEISRASEEFHRMRLLKLHWINVVYVIGRGTVHISSSDMSS